jgi:hypothetical protein
MITSIVTFLSTRFVTVFVTTIVVVVAVPSLIIAIHGNTVTITSGPVASASRQHDDERTQLIVKVKTAGDDVITKVNTEEASCDAQLTALSAKSKLSTADTDAAIAKGEGEVHAATSPYVKEINDDEAEIEKLKVVTTQTEQVFLTRISQVQVIALGENATQGTIVTVCQTVIVEITQIIVTVTVQPPSGGEGDDLRR